MFFVLAHQDKPNTFLRFNGDEDFNGSPVTSKSKASRFPTEAAAIVALEDSDYQGDFYPAGVK